MTASHGPGATALLLPDGRLLDVHDAGPVGAPVLLYHHGTPGSGSPVGALVRAAASAGLRLVAASRAGYHTSTRHPGRTVGDVAADATAVLDHLGADRCVTLGWSGGGPHALACAALAGDRVAAAGTLASVAPYDESRGTLDWMAGMGQGNLDEFGATLEGEDTLRELLSPDLPGLREITADALAGELASLLSPVDEAALTGELATDLARTMREAVSVSLDGWVDDDLAFCRPWGFDVSDITVPVSLWQGSDDLMVPFAHGRWLADRMPMADVHLVDHEGHLSLVAEADRVVAELARHL